MNLRKSEAFCAWSVTSGPPPSAHHDTTSLCLFKVFGGYRVKSTRLITSVRNMCKVQLKVHPVQFERSPKGFFTKGFLSQSVAKWKLSTTLPRTFTKIYFITILTLYDELMTTQARKCRKVWPSVVKCC